MMADDWGAVCTRHTPYGALAAIIDRLTAEALTAAEARPCFRGLDADQRAALVRQLAPIVREHTRRAIEAGWLDLQRWQ